MQMTLLFLAISTIATASVGAMFSQAKDDNCKCKNWQEVYKSGDVFCGATNEYYFSHNTNTPTMAEIEKGKKWLGDMVCTEFYEVLNSSKCLNINMGTDEGQWCYVDPNCKTLNLGFKLPNAKVAWKTCKKGDPTFRSSTPEELFSYAKEQDLWFAYFHKMAYPGSRADEGMLVNGTDFIGGYPSRLGQTLQRLVLSDSSFYYDTKGNGTVPHIIIHGHKTYEVDENPNKDERHPGTRNILKCINGCENLAENPTDSTNSISTHSTNGYDNSINSANSNFNHSTDGSEKSSGSTKPTNPNPINDSENSIKSNNPTNPNPTSPTDQEFDWFYDFHSADSSEKSTGSTNPTNPNPTSSTDQEFDWFYDFHSTNGSEKSTGSTNTNKPNPTSSTDERLDWFH